MDELLLILAKSGPFGVITALSLWYSWNKDRQLRDLYEQTLERVETMNERYHQALKETGATIQALAVYHDDDPEG